jgi:hypothetical protein
MTKSAFLLQHVYEDAEGGEDIKVIGIYSSRQSAESAKVRLSRKPGFEQSMGGFHVDEYILDQDNWAEGFLV